MGDVPQIDILTDCQISEWLRPPAGKLPVRSTLLRCWHIGRKIVETGLGSEEGASCGDGVVTRASTWLNARFNGAISYPTV